MTAPERFQKRPADERRRPEPNLLPDVAQRERTRTRFVDPYDVHPEPQPEEPGYGHGV